MEATLILHQQRQQSATSETAAARPNCECFVQDLVGACVEQLDDSGGLKRWRLGRVVDAAQILSLEPWQGRNPSTSAAQSATILLLPPGEAVKFLRRLQFTSAAEITSLLACGPVHLVDCSGCCPHVEAPALVRGLFSAPAHSFGTFDAGQSDDQFLSQRVSNRINGAALLLSYRSRQAAQLLQPQHSLQQPQSSQSSSQATNRRAPVAVSSSSGADGGSVGEDLPLSQQSSAPAARRRPAPAASISSAAASVHAGTPAQETSDRTSVSSGSSSRYQGTQASLQNLGASDAASVVTKGSSFIDPVTGVVLPRRKHVEGTAHNKGLSSLAEMRRRHIDEAKSRKRSKDRSAAAAAMSGDGDDSMLINEVSQQASMLPSFSSGEALLRSPAKTMPARLSGKQSSSFSAAGPISFKGIASLSQQRAPSMPSAAASQPAAAVTASFKMGDEQLERHLPRSTGCQQASSSAEGIDAADSTDQSQFLSPQPVDSELDRVLEALRLTALVGLDPFLPAPYLASQSSLSSSVSSTSEPSDLQRWMAADLPLHCTLSVDASHSKRFLKSVLASPSPSSSSSFSSAGLAKDEALRSILLAAERLARDFCTVAVSGERPTADIHASSEAAEAEAATAAPADFVSSVVSPGRPARLIAKQLHSSVTGATPARPDSVAAAAASSSSSPSVSTTAAAWGWRCTRGLPPRMLAVLLRLRRAYWALVDPYHHQQMGGNTSSNGNVAVASSNDSTAAATAGAPTSSSDFSSTSASGPRDASSWVHSVHGSALDPQRFLMQEVPAAIALLAAFTVSSVSSAAASEQSLMSPAAAAAASSSNPASAVFSSPSRPAAAGGSSEPAFISPARIPRSALAAQRLGGSPFLLRHSGIKQAAAPANRGSPGRLGLGLFSSSSPGTSAFMSPGRAGTAIVAAAASAPSSASSASSSLLGSSRKRRKPTYTVKRNRDLAMEAFIDRVAELQQQQPPSSISNSASEAPRQGPSLWWPGADEAKLQRLALAAGAGAGAGATDPSQPSPEGGSQRLGLAAAVVLVREFCEQVLLIPAAQLEHSLPPAVRERLAPQQASSSSAASVSAAAAIKRQPTSFYTSIFKASKKRKREEEKAKGKKKVGQDVASAGSGTSERPWTAAASSLPVHVVIRHRTLQALLRLWLASTEPEGERTFTAPPAAADLHRVLRQALQALALNNTPRIHGLPFLTRAQESQLPLSSEYLREVCLLPFGSRLPEMVAQAYLASEVPPPPELAGAAAALAAAEAAASASASAAANVGSSADGEDAAAANGAGSAPASAPAPALASQQFRAAILTPVAVPTRQPSRRLRPPLQEEVRRHLPFEEGEDGDRGSPALHSEQQQAPASVAAVVAAASNAASSAPTAMKSDESDLSVAVVSSTSSEPAKPVSVPTASLTYKGVSYSKYARFGIGAKPAAPPPPPPPPAAAAAQGTTAAAVAASAPSVFGSQSSQPVASTAATAALFDQQASSSASAPAVADSFPAVASTSLTDVSALVKGPILAAAQDVPSSSSSSTAAAAADADSSESSCSTNDKRSSSASNSGSNSNQNRAGSGSSLSSLSSSAEEHKRFALHASRRFINGFSQSMNSSSSGSSSSAGGGLPMMMSRQASSSSNYVSSSSQSNASTAGGGGSRKRPTRPESESSSDGRVSAADGTTSSSSSNNNNNKIPPEEDPLLLLRKKKPPKPSTFLADGFRASLNNIRTLPVPEAKSKRR